MFHHLHPDYVTTCHEERRIRLSRRKVARDDNGRPVRIDDLIAGL